MLRLRLRTKLLLAVIGTVAMIFAVLSVSIVQRESLMLGRKAAEREHLLARLISADLRESMLTGVPRSTLHLIENFQGKYGIVRVAVLRQDGTLAFSAGGGRIAVPRLEEAFRESKEIDFNEPGDPPVHTNLFPLKNEGECRRCHRAGAAVLGMIVISHSREDAIAEVAAAKRELLVQFILVVALVIGLLYLLLRSSVLRPIALLGAGADAYSRGNFSHRVNVETTDEFQDVAETFNAMGERLNEIYGGLERVVQDRTKELDESFRVLGGVLSSLPGGVMLLDLEGRVKLINRHGAELLRCRQADVVGTRLVEAVPAAAGLVSAAFEKAETGQFSEADYPAPGGDLVPIGFSSTYYRGAGGGYDGVIISFRDLSDFKALQTELTNRERFAAIGRLVAGVAHEVRNPLFGISSIGQIFERELTNPAHRELVQALLSESRRLNQLVEDLLLYGRPVQLRLEVCDLRKLWGDILELHRDEMRSRDVVVEESEGERLPPITLDPNQMQQVLLNLFRNALDASPRGSRITARFLVADHHLQFRLHDEGPGIPEKDRERVFDLFFTTKPKGTGLGLAICRKIIEDHGGEIGIESEEGRGTTIVVKLPYRKPPKASKPHS